MPDLATHTGTHMTKATPEFQNRTLLAIVLFGLILVFSGGARAFAQPVCNAHFTYYHATHPDSLHFGGTQNSTTAHYHWSFGDGTGSTNRDPWHRYTANGPYSVCLTVQDSTASGTCTDIWCDSIVVTGIQAPSCDAHFAHYLKTGTDSMHFYPTATTNSSTAHYFWTFGDNTFSHDKIPWHVYAAHGKYYACLTVTDTTGGGNCTATWCDSVEVAATPAPSCDAHYAFYFKSCTDSVHFYPTATTNSSAAHYYWTFGDNSSSHDKSPWHFYATPGRYYVCLTVSDSSSGGSCTNTRCDSITVAPTTGLTCNAHFTFTHATHPDTVKFVPATTSPTAKLHWSFGDGTGSTSRDPWHRYASVGAYTVCLSVTDSNACGTCSESWCDSVVVSGISAPSCDAHFAHYFKTNSDSVHFYPTATTNSSTARFFWTFGDNTVSHDKIPWHVFATHGKYYACLTVTDTTAGGVCTATWCDSVLFAAVAAPTCNAHFTSYHATHPDSVHFYGTTNSSTAKYQWSFGDGTGGTGRDPWHRYALVGVYRVCLIVTDSNASGTCTDTWCDSIAVTGVSAPSCDAHFAYYFKSCTDSVHFYPTATTNSSTARYSWSFGDNTTSHERYPWHFYQNHGKYYVCLTVTDTTAGGTCSNTWCDSVTVAASTGPSCNAHFTYSHAAHADSVKFIPPTNSSTAKFHWSFGDGTGTTSRDPWHRYTTIGTYSVCLTVSDSSACGVCSDTWCDSVEVTTIAAPNCNAHFAHYFKTCTDSVHFYPTATTNGSTAHYYWTFGDNTTSHDKIPWHVYAAYGTYQVCLTVTDTTGGGVCSHTWCDSVRFSATPPPACNAHFTHYASSNPDSLHFLGATNSSTAHYFWSFGDGGHASTRDPWHAYATHGTYQICLTVTDSSACGVCTATWCDSTVVQFVQIYPNPVSRRISVSLHNGTRPVSLEILDGKGRVVIRESRQDGQSFNVRLDGLSDGLYFYRLLDGDTQVSTGKFMLVKNTD
jgi:PKD repeat protein